MVPVKVVFQGGGAKLATLMAAASVLQDLEHEGAIEIKHIVGVSAGAIAACLLASRRPWEQCRLRAAAAAQAVIAQLEKRPSALGVLWRAYFGKRIFPEQALRDFCKAVFGAVPGGNEASQGASAAFERLGQLHIPTSIVTASIRHTEKTVYHSTRHREMRLEDALCDSCAIPFVFRTYRDTSFLVDGGVCGNLPDREVLEQTDHEFVLGFGFAIESTEPPSDVLGYARSLIETAMTSAVRDSMARIRAGRGAVFELPQTFGTFDFRNALETGLSLQGYQDVRNRLRPELDAAIEQFSDQIRTSEDETTLRNKVLKIHKQQTARFPYVVTRSAMLVTANSSRYKSDPLYDDDDEVVQVVEYSPKQQQISALRVGLSTAVAPPRSGESDYRVETMSAKPLSAIQVLASDDVGAGGLRRFYSLFFLDEPASEAVRIRRRFQQKNAMSGLGRPGGREWLRTYNTSVSDVIPVDLILFYPDHIGDLATLDLVENLQLLQPNQLPSDAEAMTRRWTIGRRMSASELDPYTQQLLPNGCRIVGWRAEKVQPAAYCGVILQRQ